MFPLKKIEKSGKPPCKDQDLLDKSYLASAYITKSVRVQLNNGRFINLETWHNKTILMRCGSRDEAIRYAILLKNYSRGGGDNLSMSRRKHTRRGAKRTWYFKFLYPGGSVITENS